MAERLCSRCGETNPNDAQFCIDCGAALTNATTGPTTRLPGIVCPVCYTYNPDTAQFCAGCGRSFVQEEAPQPKPQPAAPKPQPPRPHYAPPRQSFPRTATPPQLSPYRPSASQHNPGPIVFLIGLGILFMTGTIWPGILILIGISALFNQLAQGHTDKAVKAMVWFGAMALLFGNGRFWPGGLIVLLILGAIMGGWGGPHRRIW